MSDARYRIPRFAASSVRSASGGASLGKDRADLGRCRRGRIRSSTFISPNRFKLRVDNGALQTAPDTVVVGPQGARQIQLYMPREMRIFNIHLPPAGAQPPGRDRHDRADQ